MRAVPGVPANELRNSSKFSFAVGSRRIMETWWQVLIRSAHHQDTKTQSSAKPRLLEMGQDVFAVGLQGVFLVPAHEVDVELCHAQVEQFPESATVFRNRAHYAIAIDDLIRDECGIVAADLCMVSVIVAFSIPDVRRKARGKLLRLVTRDQIHHMVGNE